MTGMELQNICNKTLFGTFFAVGRHVAADCVGGIAV